GGQAKSCRRRADPEGRRSQAPSRPFLRRGGFSQQKGKTEANGVSGAPGRNQRGIPQLARSAGRRGRASEPLAAARWSNAFQAGRSRLAWGGHRRITRSQFSENFRACGRGGARTIEGGPDDRGARGCRPGPQSAGWRREISPTASLDFTAGWPIPRNFSVDVVLSESDSRLTPGMGATVRVAVAKIPDGIVIPSTALFRKAGRSVVYVQRGSKFEETPVEVSRRNPEEVLLARGLEPGKRVATKDPMLTH